jgi:hypothetical protein
MNRRAEVVNETRQCELGRAKTAAEFLRGLVNFDLQPGPRKRDRRRQPIRPGAYDDRPFHLGGKTEIRERAGTRAL